MYVSDKKRSDTKIDIWEKCGCMTGCSKCLHKAKFVDAMADANVPSAYWFRKFGDFNGHESIKKATIDYIKDIKQNYKTGKSLCFAGQLGTGKTYSLCSILKSALISKYSVYYTTLSDLVFYLSDYELKKEFYSKLIRADFLCIDEIDSRHVADTENSIEFFGRNLERILRYRAQNQLPTLMATNNAMAEEAFSGQFKKVIGSLTSLSTVLVPALGHDYRQRKGLNDR